MNSFFFWHFTLAHFLTDYPFQTDKLFYKKTKYIYGILIHGALLFLSMLILSYPYISNLYVLICIFLLTLLHIIQDKLKVFLSYHGEIGENFFYYLIDQVLHIFTIFLFTTYFPLPEVKGEGLWFDPFYFKLFTFIIVITYAYWILIYSVEFTFFKINSLPQGKCKYMGFIERLSAFILFLFNPFLSGFSFLFSFYFLKKKEKVNFVRSFLGIVLTILTAYIFKEVII